jgi:Transposase DDE domain
LEINSNSPNLLQSTPESGNRAGYDGYKRKKGSKVHAADDTLGHLLAVKVTAANEQGRAQVADLIKAVSRKNTGAPGSCQTRLSSARTARDGLRCVRNWSACVWSQLGYAVTGINMLKQLDKCA